MKHLGLFILLIGSISILTIESGCSHKFISENIADHKDVIRRSEVKVSRELLAKLKSSSSMVAQWKFIDMKVYDDLPAVEAAYLALLKRNPNDPNYLFGWGYSAMQEQMPSYFMRHRGEWNPSPEEFRSRRKRIWESLKKAGQLAPKSAEPHFALAYYFVYTPINGTLEQKKLWATQQAMIGLTLNPKSAIGYDALGMIKDYSSNTEEAIHYYKKALILDPTYYRSYMHLFSSYIGSHKKIEARSAFNKIEKIAPFIVSKDPDYIIMKRYYATH